MKYWRTPLDQQAVEASRGKVVIIADRCKGCEFCVGVCPKDNIRMSEMTNGAGHRYAEVIDEIQCTGCGLCFRLCPDIAIEIKNEDHDQVKDKKDRQEQVV